MSKLIFEYSAMNAGKSTKLLQMNYNYKSINKNPLLLKPALDTRDIKISSRLGISSECINIDKDEDISLLFEKLNKETTTKYNIILVDEAQFLTKLQVLQIRNIVDTQNIDAICFGIRTDWEGDLFEGSLYLMARADKLNENITLCHCGKKATMVLKIDLDGNVVKKGEKIDCGYENKYISVCHKHWNLKQIVSE
jgi:thymidine kinase